MSARDWLLLAIGALVGFDVCGLLWIVWLDRRMRIRR